MSILLLL
jgi:aminoacylase